MLEGKILSMDCGIDQDPVTNDPLQGAYKSDPAAKPTTLVPKGLMTLQPCSTEATICPVGVDRIAMEYDDLAMGTVPPFKALCFSASGWSMREGTTSTRYLKTLAWKERSLSKLVCFLGALQGAAVSGSDCSRVLPLSMGLGLNAAVAYCVT